MADQLFRRTLPFSDETINSIFQHHLGVRPLTIEAPPHLTGEYNRIYFIDLPSFTPKDGDDLPTRPNGVILRVARPAYPRVKVENEVGWLDVARENGIPVPEVLFYNADVERYGYEYICMERIPHPSLSSVYKDLSREQVEDAVSQVVEVIVKQWRVKLPGQACFGGQRSVDSIGTGGNGHEWGAYLEESMWEAGEWTRQGGAGLPAEADGAARESQLPFGNPVKAGPYPDYLALLHAFLESYIHIIPLHSGLDHLIPLITPIKALLADLQSYLDNPTLTPPIAKSWIARVRSVRPRWTNGDMHFGNVLWTIAQSKIAAIIDWEFSKTLPAFYRNFSPIDQIHGMLKQELAEQGVESRVDVDMIPEMFMKAMKELDVEVYEEFAAESDEVGVLGEEGQALKTLREYLRSCIEVGVRGGRQEAGRGAWKDVCVESLRKLGYWSNSDA